MPSVGVEIGGFSLEKVTLCNCESSQGTPLPGDGVQKSGDKGSLFGAHEVLKVKFIYAKVIDNNTAFCDMFQSFDFAIRFGLLGDE